MDGLGMGLGSIGSGLGANGSGKGGYLVGTPMPFINYSLDGLLNYIRNVFPGFAPLAENMIPAFKDFVGQIQHELALGQPSNVSDMVDQASGDISSIFGNQTAYENFLVVIGFVQQYNQMDFMADTSQVPLGASHTLSLLGLLWAGLTDHNSTWQVRTPCTKVGQGWPDGLPTQRTAFQQIADYLTAGAADGLGAWWLNHMYAMDRLQGLLAAAETAVSGGLTDVEAIAQRVTAKAGDLLLEVTTHNTSLFNFWSAVGVPQGQTITDRVSSGLTVNKSDGTLVTIASYIAEAFITVNSNPVNLLSRLCVKGNDGKIYGLSRALAGSVFKSPKDNARHYLFLDWVGIHQSNLP